MTTTLADIPVQQAKCQQIREEHRQWGRRAPPMRVWGDKQEWAPGVGVGGGVSGHPAGGWNTK
ncbi:hypothetical protein [Nocardia gipuzkoensis]|uniref:hypothetical protein n=1 Tax=Nocardia gipuzkoensis TaxID=2749991 RepID=UPI0024537B3A|nr:hypothetical protein [Nocardia gipuzkoensis]